VLNTVGVCRERQILKLGELKWLGDAPNVGLRTNRKRLEHVPLLWLGSHWQGFNDWNKIHRL
jgi:hypothetical protein